MKNFIQKQTVASYALCASLFFGLVGFIIYLVNSTTGYLAGTAVDGWLIAITLIAFALIVVEFVLHDKIDLYNGLFNDLILIVVGVLFAIGTCLFIVDRVGIAADVYFIPVNFPVAEGTALNIGITGVAFYAVAMICAAVAAFWPKGFYKEIEA